MTIRLRRMELVQPARASRVFLVALVAVGLVLRLMHLGADPPMSLSTSNAEIMDGPWYMAEAIDTARGQTVDVASAHRRPLFTAMMRLGFLGGVSLERAHVVEAIAGALLIAFAAAAARRAFGARAAVVTALLLAVGFVPVGYGRTTVVYGPLAAVLAAVFWILTWSVPPEDVSPQEHSRTLLARLSPWAAVLLLGAAAAGLQAIAILMAPALAVGLAIGSRRRALLVILVAVAVSAALLTLGIVPMSIVDITMRKTIGYLGSMSPLDLMKRWLRAPFISGLWPKAPLLCALGWLGVLVFFARGAGELDPRRRHLERTLALWFVVWISMLSVFEYDGEPPLRYFMPALVPAALLAGSVIDRLLTAPGLPLPTTPWLLFVWAVLGFYWSAGTVLTVIWPFVFPAGAAHWIENAVSFAGLISGAVVFGAGLAIALRQKPPGALRLAWTGGLTLLSLGLVADAIRLYPMLAKPEYSLRDANGAVAELIGPGASIYGPYAHALTYDAPDVSRHMEEFEYRTIRQAMAAKKKGWTHMIVGLEDGLKVEAVLWGAGAPMARLGIVRVRGYPIALYRFEWAEALGYRLSPIEEKMPHHTPPP